MSWMMAISAASSFVDYAEKRNIANQKEAQARETARQATIARDLKIQQLGVRAEQQAEAIASKKRLNAIEALKLQERNIVAAGEAGIAGNAVKMKAFDLKAQELRKDRDYTLQNLAIQQQIEMEALGINSQAINTINNLPRGQQPSFLTAVAKAGANAYSADKSFNDGEFFGQFEDFDIFGDTGDLFSTNTEALPSPEILSASNQYARNKG